MLQLVGLLGWPKGGCVASSPPAVLQCGCLFSKMCISKVKVLRGSSVQLYITLCRCNSVVFACVLPRPPAAVGLLLGITSPCHAEIVCNPVTMATSGCSTLARFLLLNGWTRPVSHRLHREHRITGLAVCWQSLWASLRECRHLQWEAAQCNYHSILLIRIIS